MLKPIGYYFSSREVLSAGGVQTTVFNSVHLLPNPALYLFSLMAILIMSLKWMSSFFEVLATKTYESEFAISSLILLGFYANFLPWAFVSRSAFLYHYQPASGFAFLALGFLLYKVGLKPEIQYKFLYLLVLFLIVAAFLYWLPLQLGLDIDRESFYNRMWRKSWI
jgi:dolichyl-phosphate-mannose--protein O-mannosyl transferase